MKRWRRKWFMYAIVVILIGWPLIQVIQMLSHSAKTERPDKLLYQVSLFQMDMLGSYLQDTSKFKTTDSLNAVRQALYSADYTHEHLVLAYGDEKLAKLESLTGLMQYILRLQVGGARALRPDETQVIEEVSRQFNEMYDAYGKLLSSGGDVVPSQSSKLSKIDKAMSDVLKKKLLQ